MMGESDPSASSGHSHSSENMEDTTTGLVNKCHVSKRTAYQPQKSQLRDNHHGEGKSLATSTPRGTAFQFSDAKIGLTTTNGRKSVKGRSGAALQPSRKRSMPFEEPKAGQICGYRKADALTTRAAAYPSVLDMVLQRENVEDRLVRPVVKYIISKQDELEEMVNLGGAPLKKVPTSQRSNLDNARPTIKIRFSEQEAFHIVAKRRNFIVEMAGIGWEVCDELLKQAHGTLEESDKHNLVASSSRIWRTTLPTTTNGAWKSEFAKHLNGHWDACERHRPCGRFERSSLLPATVLRRTPRVRETTPISIPPEGKPPAANARHHLFPSRGRTYSASPHL
ncbi:hypothetical protein AB5N19_13540 [Seiridium cardinale]